MTQLIQGFQVSEYTGQTSMPRNLGVEDRIEYLEERIRDYQEAIKTWKEYGTGHTVLLPTDKWRMQVVGNDGRFDAKEGELLLIVTMADANKFVQHLVIPFSEFSQNLVSADDLKRMVSDFIATPSVSDGVEKIR